MRLLASDNDTDLIFVECVSSEEVILSRLEEREQLGSVSDARGFHLPDMVRAFEPLAEVPRDVQLRADSSQCFDKVFLGVLSEAYARKWAQIANRINEISTTASG